MLEAQTRTNIVITDQTTCFGPYPNRGMFSVITALAHIKILKRTIEEPELKNVKIN